MEWSEDSCCPSGIAGAALKACKVWILLGGKLEPLFQRRWAQRALVKQNLDLGSRDCRLVLYRWWLSRGWLAFVVFCSHQKKNVLHFVDSILCLRELDLCISDISVNVLCTKEYSLLKLLTVLLTAVCKLQPFWQHLSLSKECRFFSFRTKGD